MRQGLCLEIDPAFADAKVVRDGLSPLELMRLDFQSLAGFLARLRRPRGTKAATR
ncbi:hypothetical protein [Afifella pfennigii]|uniref:hypothetical protein n=1 Tax=Afifella pfennigii TaxID=209897 RepID=UPI0012EB3993|nr:hypothetical protein [Afifella pfennigii]